MTRRGFFRFLGKAVGLAMVTGAYGFALEPMRLVTSRYRVRPSDWPQGLRLRIVALADLHACDPWVSVDRIRSIVAKANDLRPDLIVLLGDYTMGHHWVTAQVHSRDWAAALGGLRAPLGVHAVMGNHDWWEDRTAQREGEGPTFGERALLSNGIEVYENRAVRIEKEGRAFWLAGLGDQIALLPGHGGRRGWQGVDDLPGTLAQITDDAPVILLAHEPDIFPRVPGRVALTLSGHTHGGQVRLFGWSPIVPSRYGNRYAYGHIAERDRAGMTRHLVVSGGIGGSIMPVRIGVPPEIVVVDLA